MLLIVWVLATRANRQDGCEGNNILRSGLVESEAMWKALREWWKGKKLTAFGVFLFVIAIVPRWVSIGRFWYGLGLWIWERTAWLSTGWGRVALVVVGLSLIWLDQYRRSRPKAHDLGTLKGRTLKLRDDLKSFVDAIGPKPKIVRTGMSDKEYLAATWKEVAPWMDRLTYGYERRFAARAREVYLEFGERSLLPGVGLDLPEGLASTDDIQRIIDGLGKFAAALSD